MVLKLKECRMMRAMRTYGQYCPMAKTLEILGDRWTLLIVRELLIRPTLRYTDLEAGLPGIASNLLAERLRDLVAEGIVTREAAPPPIATTVYGLTPRGHALRPVLHALGAWGSASQWPKNASVSGACGRYALPQAPRAWRTGRSA